jgi:hypothetical protein
MIGFLGKKLDVIIFTASASDNCRTRNIFSQPLLQKLEARDVLKRVYVIIIVCRKSKLLKFISQFINNNLINTPFILNYMIF